MDKLNLLHRKTLREAFNPMKKDKEYIKDIKETQKLVQEVRKLAGKIYSYGFDDDETITKAADEILDELKDELENENRKGE
jgi:hypothetical protein